jgi:hypothetical protein
MTGCSIFAKLLCLQISVECLGSNILSKATTSGLGSIQKPLYEKYIQYRKSGKGKKSQPVWLKVNPEGITVIFPASKSHQVLKIEIQSYSLYIGCQECFCCYQECFSCML